MLKTAIFSALISRPVCFTVEDAFTLFVDRLRGGNTEEIKGDFSPDFLGVHEEDLVFDNKVKVKGEVYLTDDSLVIRVDITTVATMPCAICNKKTAVPIEVRGFYHIVPLSEIKGAVYNMQEALREAILLEIPQFAECEGKCPRREEIAKYMKDAAADTGMNGDFHPFADLK